MLVFDTNVLLYSMNRRSEFHDACKDVVERWQRDPAPAFLTWSVCYEFLRVSTHPKVLSSPLSANNAWEYIDSLVNPPGGFNILTPTERHATVLLQTLREFPELRGNVFHDLHIAVLMREHGISQICTRDTDFYRFPFLTVVDPLR